MRNARVYAFGKVWPVCVCQLAGRNNEDNVLEECSRSTGLAACCASYRFLPKITFGRMKDKYRESVDGLSVEK